MAQYRVLASIPAVERGAAGFWRIAPGETIDLLDTGQQSGFVEIVNRGRNLAVFIEDLKDRSECIEPRQRPAPQSRESTCQTSSAKSD